MPKTITFNKEFYVNDGSDILAERPKGTKTRVYTGDFVTVTQDFYPDGTMEFVVFTKDTHKHLKTFNRSQMNDLIGIMEIVADRKKELYPPEFL